MLVKAKTSLRKFGWQVLFAPWKLRGLLVARAFMYYGFMMLWWAALSTIRPGDAVAIVYCNPILSAIFANLLLGEPTNPAVPYCIVLATLGVLWVTARRLYWANDRGRNNSGQLQTAPLSVGFHSFRLIFRRAIVSRSGLEA